MVVSVLSQESQTTDRAWYKLQLLERVNLLVFGFSDDGSVAVYKEYFLHVNLSVECLLLSVERLILGTFFLSGLDGAVDVVVVYECYLTDVELNETAQRGSSESQ